MGLISGLVAMLGWGIGDFFAALSSRKFGNFLTYFWMMLVSFVVASVYFLVNIKTFDFSAVPGLLILLTCVAALQVIAYLAFYNGLEKGLVSIVSPIGSTFSAITVILSVVFYNEQLVSRQVLAIFLVLISVVFVSLDLKEIKNTKKIKLISGVKQGAIASFGWGISLFLIVTASNALGWFLPIYIFRFIAILLLVCLILLGKREFKTPSELRSLVLLLPIGLLDITAFFSYSLGVVSTYASIVATISGAFAIVTVMLAFIILKERLSINQTAGVLGVILGIILLSF